MYVAMLLTDWNVVRPDKSDTGSVYIGRSETAMWMRIVSSWMCMLIYIWTLVAPVLLPDRYVFPSSQPRNMSLTIHPRFDDI
jgi:hypothetical protein